MNATPVTELTEGQLYDEANAIMFAQQRGERISEQRQSRLAELEAEFWARHAKALAA